MKQTKRLTRQDEKDVRKNFVYGISNTSLVCSVLVVLRHIYGVWNFITLTLTPKKGVYQIWSTTYIVKRKFLLR